MTEIRMVDAVHMYFQGIGARFGYSVGGIAIVACCLADNTLGEDVMEALIPIKFTIGQYSFIPRR